MDPVRRTFKEDRMRQPGNGLQVTQAAGELAPLSFRWAGHLVRVLYVESVRTHGRERRYRVQTPKGLYELGLDTAGKVWRLCHSPTWFTRTWTTMRQLPRYPLPNHRQRSLGAPAAVEVRPGPVPANKGGGHADGFALVRQ
jgi:hypothetical protein